MMRKVAILFLLTIFCGLTAAQDNGDSGIIFGEHYSFTLTAPKGWVLDNGSGKGQGLQAVFYPKGSSWKNGAAVMYANVYQKRDPGKESLQTVIAGDVAEYQKESPKLTVVDADRIPTRKDERSKGKEANIKYFAGDRNGNYEAVAYINEGKVVVMLVLTTRSKNDFGSSLSAFKELVGSYFFLGEAVIH